MLHIYNTIFCKKFTNSKITLDNGEYLWYNSDTSNGAYFFVSFYGYAEPPFKTAIPRPREAIMPEKGKKIGGAESES